MKWASLLLIFSSVTAFSYCNTGEKLFICSTEINLISAYASSLPVPFVSLLLFWIRSDVCGASKAFRSLLLAASATVRHRPLILTPSTCYLQALLQGCRDEAVLSTTITGHGGEKNAAPYPFSVKGFQCPVKALSADWIWCDIHDQCPSEMSLF